MAFRCAARYYRTVWIQRIGSGRNIAAGKPVPFEHGQPSRKQTATHEAIRDPSVLPAPKWPTAVRAAAAQFIDSPGESRMTRANVCRLASAPLGMLVLLVIVGSARRASGRPEDLGVIPTPQEVTWSKASPDDSCASTPRRKSCCPTSRPTARIRRRQSARAASRANGSPARDHPRPRRGKGPQADRHWQPQDRSARCRIDEGVRAGADRCDGEGGLRAGRRPARAS